MHDPALQTQNGRERKGRGKCECCPYGYHLDLDFVRYCEKVSASGLLVTPRSTLPRQSRKKRESRESLLGLTNQVTSELQTKPPENKKVFERAFSDDLEKAVLDFEKIFKSSSRSQNNDEIGGYPKLDNINDIKYRTIAVDRIKDPFDHLKLNGTNNEIRHQMAASLCRMRQLEEEVKTIPNLQNQLKKLRWENRRLIKLLENSEKKTEPVERKVKERVADGVHTRTIGTGCSVLRRDVGTSCTVELRARGTDPITMEENSRITYSEMSSQTFYSGKDVGVDCRVPSFDASVQCTSMTAAQTSHASTQCRPTEPIKPYCHVGVQVATIPKVFTSHASVQHNSTPIPAAPLQESGSQTDSTQPQTYNVGVQSKPRNMDMSTGTHYRGFDHSTQTPKLTSKDFGISVNTTVEKVPLKSVGVNTTVIEKLRQLSIGVSTDNSGLDRTTQTLRLSTRDFGLNVDTSPEKAVLKSIGTNTKVIEDRKPISKSKQTDTIGLFNVKETAVNTTKEGIVDESTGTTGLEATSKKLESRQKLHLNLSSSSFKEKSTKSPSHIPVYQHSLRLSSKSHDKSPVFEAVQEKSSPIASAAIPKPYEKKEPSKEMKGAMKVLNDNLMKSPSGEFPKNLRNAINIVQQEWFKISSTADANPLDVEDYLDCFEEMSVALLEYIVNMTDVSGNTAMHYAVSNGNFDVVSILLDSKVCNINKLNTAGYTCIMLVALSKVKSEADRQVVRRLFQMADVNIRARQHGQTALMLAVSHGRIDTVELLLESGADINIQDEDGSTALMCAAEHGYIDIVKLLLAQPDCDLSLTDLDGNTALNISMEAGNRDIGVLLYAQEHFSRGASPFNTLKARRAKSATPTLKTRTPTPPFCSQEHSL